MKLRTAAALVLIASAAGTTRVQAQAIINGDFESPVIPPSSFSQLDVIPGWTPAFGFIEIQSNFFLGPGNGTPSGNQYVELNAVGPSTIRSNAFATNPGQEYVVSYLYAARPGGPLPRPSASSLRGRPR